MNYDYYIQRVLELAFAEDVGDGDHTSLATIPADKNGKARLVVKDEGVIAGIDLARKIFSYFDPGLKFNPLLKDGDKVRKGELAFIVEGKTQSILQCERLVLNFMQRMSGIATQTARYVKEIEGTGAQVLDTRKTTPGLRLIEKEAVKIGGGVNHRIGLYDMIMIKDNHVDYAGGIVPAVESVMRYLKEKNKPLKIVLEIRNFDELDQILAFGNVDRLLLDNFTPEDTKKAVQIVRGRYETESSGSITLATIRKYAECGVDYISVGALTHNVKSLDLSLKAFY